MTLLLDIRHSQSNFSTQASKGRSQTAAYAYATQTAREESGVTFVNERAPAAVSRPTPAADIQGSERGCGAEALWPKLPWWVLF